jgi:hypothetical protein
MGPCDEAGKGLRTATTTTVSGVPELSVPAIKVVGLITSLFTAAMVYLALKVGSRSRPPAQRL